MILFTSVFLLCFTYIIYHNRNLGLLLFFFLLPTYLVRFTILTLPTTLLELLFFITTATILFHPKKGLWHTKKHIFTFSYYKTFFAKHPSLVLATTLFCISSTIAIGVALDTTKAIGAWKAFFIEPVVFAYLLAHVIEKKRDIEYILFGIVLSGLATSVLAIYQHFTGWMVPWDFWENRNTYRVTGWYGFPNGVGIYLAPIISFAGYLIETTATKTKKHVRDHAQLWLSIICIPLALLSIIYAKSTGPLIGVAAATGLWFLLHKKTRTWTIVCIVLAGMFFFSLPAENPIKKEVLAQDRSGQIRKDMWAESVEYLRVHPITGAGLMSYQKEIWPYRIDKWIEVFHHPHNTILTMWMNIGFFGMFAFVWICVWLARVSLQHIVKKQSMAHIYMLCVLTTFLVMGLVDSPYIKNDMAMLFWLLPAWAVYSCTKKSTQ